MLRVADPIGAAPAGARTRYAKDAPVPGTTLFTEGRDAAEQIGEWFSGRLATTLPDGSTQMAVAVDVEMLEDGGIARAVLLRVGGDGHAAMAWAARFLHAPDDPEMDVLHWREARETDGLDDAGWPPHLLAMLGEPVNEASRNWRRAQPAD